MTGRGLARFAASRGGPAPQASEIAAGRERDGGPRAQIPADRPPDDRPHPDEAEQVLARFARPRRPPTPGEACELCGGPVPQDHRHVVDLERRGMLCACRGCALMFLGRWLPAGRWEWSDQRVERSETTKFTGDAGRYRTVPDRYLRIDPFDLSPQTWAALQIPVGVAFMVHNTQMERTVGFYPSPGGSTESELPLDAWSDVVAANPGLAQAEPDVEAVLIRVGTDGDACFIVPVDRCYELVGALRLNWRGFDGGQEVREHMERFFADVERRSRRGPRRDTPAPDDHVRPAAPSRSSRPKESSAEAPRPLVENRDRT